MAQAPASVKLTASPSDKLHAEVLGPGLDAINGLRMHTVADEELVLGLTPTGVL